VKSEQKSFNEQAVLLSTGRSGKPLGETTTVIENEDDKRRGLVETTKQDVRKSLALGGSEIGTRFNHSAKVNNEDKEELLGPGFGDEDY
jgi:hypothetical protein